MRQCVVSNPFTCPRCNKENCGASVAILDFLSCPTCFYEGYEKELQPKVVEMVRAYFNGPKKVD